jgi:hypothetical protein
MRLMAMGDLGVPPFERQPEPREIAEVSDAFAHEGAEDPCNGYPFTADFLRWERGMGALGLGDAARQFRSHAVRSVWEGTETVHLIGLQHLDLSLEPVRQAVLGIAPDLAGVVMADVLPANSLRRQAATLVLMWSMPGMPGIGAEEAISALASPSVTREAAGAAVEWLPAHCLFIMEMFGTLVAVPGSR